MTAARGSAHSPANTRAAETFLWAVFFLLTFLHLLRFPTEVHGAGLDDSWQQCLAYFLKHHFRAGVDYVWTYGPLGYFATQSYDADLFWWKYGWEVVVNLVLAGLLTGVGACLRSRLLQIAYVVIVLGVGPRWDTYYLAALAWPAVLVLRAERPPAGVLSAVGAWWAVLGLVKFTWLLVAASAWLLLAAAFRRERGRRVEALLAFPLALAALWLALAQSPRDFGGYLAASWQIAAGYGEAMAVAGSERSVVLALAVLLALGVLAAVWLRAAGRRFSTAVGFAILGVCVLLAWKHGFTRQPSHQVLFFGFVALVPFAGAALASADAPPGRLAVGLTLAVAVAAAVGHGGLTPPADWCRRLADDTRDLVTPLALRHRCQARHDVVAAELALPRLSAVVGTETVDQLSCDQAVVLLNRWNYRPRPVFQGYSAYTPALLADNAAFFRGGGAPRFVLWRLRAVDDRLPASEDGPALLEVFRRYRPVAEEGGFVLLERQPPSANSARTVLWEGEAGFGEEVRLGGLPGAAHVVTIRIEDTPGGKLTKLFFRPPPIFLRVRTDDGEESRYRLIPALASAGFLLDPLLRDDEDVMRWYHGGTVPRVVAFAVEGSAAVRACYGERWRVVVEETATPAEGP